ncbi:MAG TPA: hypothetical protein VIA80_08085 [Hyphomonadaceae bacterium]
MRKETLEFLKHERDHLARQLRLLQRGEWEVVQAGKERENLTATVVAATEAQVLRFEEMIAAYESRLG